MKRITKYKNLISLALVLIVLTINVVPKSHAVGGILPQRVAAMIASGITALNIGLSGLYMPAQTFATEEVIDPLHLYTTQAESDYQEYLDMSEIKIDRNVVTIDGVSYDNVWLSNEAAEKFRVEAMDFKTAYSIASNTNGTYASGTGKLDDTLIYDLDGTDRSVNYSVPAVTGTTTNGSVDLNYQAQPYQGIDMWTYYYNNSNVGNASGIVPVNLQYYIEKIPGEANRFKIMESTRSRPQAYEAGRFTGSSYDDTDFEFDWTAGEIPLTPIPSDYGINYRVPSTVINNVYNNYYGDDVTEWPDFSTPVSIDVETPDGALLAVMIADLIADTIDALKNDGNIIINYAPQPDTPIPPEPDVPQPAPDVDPDTPASEITYNDYYQTITNQTTYMTESIDNIDNSIQNVIENQDQIIENQDTIIQESIPEIIENIPKIDEICNNIDTAPYHDLDNGLDHLPTVFLPFITDLRSALGIWHYVTEWIGQISSTFAFVTGCLVGTSIMTPIYAAIAGFMCIKVYRRMTG